MDEKPRTIEGSVHSDVDTLDKSSCERRRDEIRHSNLSGMASSHSGVDVEKAEHDFSELNIQFSRISKKASRVSKTKATADVEQARSSADDEWDLEATLRGNRAAEEEAGIKDKHIGMLTRLK